MDYLSLANLDTNLASWMHERIIKQINNFEENLPSDKQAGGRFVSSPDGMVFSIEDVGYHNPDMIIFYGTTKNGDKVRLLQHTSQLNLLLVAVPRTDDLTQERRKIGFALPSKDQQP